MGVTKRGTAFRSRPRSITAVVAGGYRTSHPSAQLGNQQRQIEGLATIADVSMIDSRHAFVLGKGFGATNIVALDADGKQVINDPISVFGHTGNTVILHRGTQQATLTCGNARCEAAPTPGDDKDSFSSRMEQLAQHQDAGTKAAGSGR